MSGLRNDKNSQTKEQVTMNLTRPQFEVLAFLEQERDGKSLTQRNIAQLTGLSVGTVNKTYVFLVKHNLIENNRVSEGGLNALEPYRVKRAVFFAADLGPRLIPITLNTPKALIRIKGIRLIDTLLDAICAIGIEEIIIVRGFLGEQFDQLNYKYPKIQFLENPLYNESNSISSAMAARFLFQNAYILESDLLLKDPSLISKYQYTSNYLGVPTERTDALCFETRHGIITRIKVGGRNCHRMFGISYWNGNDGAKLQEHIKQVYEMPGGRERFWDQVPLE
jgi:CTP:phosphocholine cytidylyltransferase-like protein